METAFSIARSALERSGKFAYGAVSERIADSWRRCLRAGLDPLAKPEECVISFQELSHRREALDRVMKLVRPELELLSAQIAGSNFLIAFADNEGVILDQILDEDFRNSACGQSIVPGSVWREDIRGTNALGLTLHTGRSSMVTGAEHFFSGHGGVSCLSAPILDSTGNLIGLIDASSEVAARQFHTQALVNLAATNVGNRLFVDDHRDEFIVQLHPRREYLSTQSVGMIALDENGKITGVNRRTIDMLSGSGLEKPQYFSNVFQGHFQPTMERLSKGEDVNIVDWLNSSYFARLRLTHSSQARRQNATIFLPVESITQIKAAKAPARTELIFEDEVLRHNLKLATKAARLGAAIAIHGPVGSGKNSAAFEIHNRIHPKSAFVTIACESANLEAVEGKFIAQMKSPVQVEGAIQTEIDLAAGGTLYLDNINELPVDMVSIMRTLFNRLFQRKHPILSLGDWVIVSSFSVHECQIDDQAKDRGPASHLIKLLSGFELVLPELEKRSDFQKLAHQFLASISLQHSLSKAATDLLFDRTWEQNFHTFGRQLRSLAVHHHEGVIREDGVLRILGDKKATQLACERCIGHPINEARCLEIRSALNECNGNVALTARQLGLSRNTVYSHVREKSG